MAVCLALVDCGVGVRSDQPPPSTDASATSAPGGGAVCVPIGGGIREPKRIKYVEPAPPDATVDYSPDYVCDAEYELVVAEDGSVADVRVVRASPTGCAQSLYHRQLIQAIRQWRYETTVVRERPVAVCLAYRAKVDLRRR